MLCYVSNSSENAGSQEKMPMAAFSGILARIPFLLDGAKPAMPSLILLNMMLLSNIICTR